MLPFKWTLSEMSETEIKFFDTKVYKGGNSCILQAFYKTKDGSFVKFWLLPLNFGSGLKTGKTENRAKEYNFMIAGFYILDFLSSLVMKKHIAKWSD